MTNRAKRIERVIKLLQTSLVYLSPDGSVGQPDAFNLYLNNAMLVLSTVDAAEEEKNR
jgi:hypothetical protein